MTKYHRNADNVKAALKETESGQLITTVPCKIQIPERYISKGQDLSLGQIGLQNYILGIFALILADGSYAVSLVPAMIRITPNRILKTLVQEVEYYDFYFDAYQIVSDQLQLVRRDTLIYPIFDEFITRGHIPWFIDYNDLGRLFTLAAEFADSNIAQNYEIMELIASVVSRVPEDRTRYYRTLPAKTSPPAYVPMQSVFYAATNTMSKLAGNYFNDGLISALVHETKTVERLEKILRA